MTRPDFFVVGAPKCGTTALTDYLKRHSEIYMPPVKEPHFFGTDLVFSFPRPGLTDYLGYFRAAGHRKRAGEASVWYLFSRRAAAEIRAFSPDARIIVMLRNPVDMMYSLHAQRVYNGNEDLLDFEEALAAEDDRRRGRRRTPHMSNTMGMRYREAARFTDQVQRFLAVFGPQRVQVISFDDFAADTVKAYAETCRFLDVDDTFRPPQFQAVNTRKTVRSRRLRDLLHHPTPRVALLFRAVGLRPGRSGAYRGWLKRLNSKPAPAVPMPRTLRQALQHEFAPELARLSELLGRDFTHWSRK